MGTTADLQSGFPTFSRFNGPRDALFFDDFMEIYASTTQGAARWYLFETNAAATELIVEQNDAIGCLRLQQAAVDNDVISLIANWGFRLDGVGGQVLLGARSVVFGARFKTANVDDVDLHIGLGIYDDSYAGSPPADMCVFQLSEGSANLKMVVSKDSNTNGSPSLLALTDNTWYRVVFEYTPNADTPSSGLLVAYVNGQKYLSQNVSTFPDDVYLHPVIQVQNGAAVADATDLDWVYCHVVRANYVDGTG